MLVSTNGIKKKTRKSKQPKTPVLLQTLVENVQVFVLSLLPKNEPQTRSCKNVDARSKKHCLYRCCNIKTQTHLQMRLGRRAFCFCSPPANHEQQTPRAASQFTRRQKRHKNWSLTLQEIPPTTDATAGPGRRNGISRKRKENVRKRTNCSWVCCTGCWRIVERARSLRCAAASLCLIVII